MNTNEWLQNLKAEDKVYIDGRYGSAGVIGRVFRVTKTMIVVASPQGFNTRYRKEDGFSVGEDSYTGGIIRELTQERIDEVKLCGLKNKAVMLRGKLAIPQTEAELKWFIKVLKSFCATWHR